MSFWIMSQTLFGTECCRGLPSTACKLSLNSIRTKKCSSYTCHLSVFLQKELQLPWERLHLLGYSLGAHVAGVAGDLTDHKISRITGKNMFWLTCKPQTVDIDKPLHFPALLQLWQCFSQCIWSLAPMKHKFSLIPDLHCIFAYSQSLPVPILFFCHYDVYPALKSLWPAWKNGVFTVI